MFCLLVMTEYCGVLGAKGGLVCGREHHDSPEAERLSQVMQKRIMFSINGLCWAIFIIIDALHYASPIDATNWYATFALIVLPIKAVINPLLYDSTITKFISSKVRGARAAAGGSQIELARLEPEGGSVGPGEALLEKEDAVEPKEIGDNKIAEKSDSTESSASGDKNVDEL